MHVLLSTLITSREEGGGLRVIQTHTYILEPREHPALSESLFFSKFSLGIVRSLELPLSESFPDSQGMT